MLQCPARRQAMPSGGFGRFQPCIHEAVLILPPFCGTGRMLPGSHSGLMKRRFQVWVWLALIGLTLLFLPAILSRVAQGNRTGSALLPPTQPVHSSNGLPARYLPTSVTKAFSDAQTNAEPVEAFSRWLRNFTTTTEAEPELGLELAHQRRKVLRELIRSDPEEALRMRIPFALRQRLPAAIQEQLEELVSARGDLAVFSALPYLGREADFRAVQRWATIGGRPYEAFVYGRRASQRTSREVSLHRIAVDGWLALSDSPVRVLDPEEPASAGKQPANNQCPISGKAVASTTAQLSTPETPLVESGDRVYQLCSLAHVAALSEQLWSQEQTVATANWLSTGANDVLVMVVDFPDLPGANATANDVHNVMNDVDAFYHDNSFQHISFDAVHVSHYLL